MSKELEVLVEQVGELLADWPTDGEDAIELATVAGLAARLGATGDDLAEAEAWREGVGAELLEEGWGSVEIEAAVDAVDGVCSGSATEDEVEEALYEFDELVAAAIWTGQQHRIRAAAARVSRSVRDVSDVFVAFADEASIVVALEGTARDLDLYDYWLGIAASQN